MNEQHCRDREDGDRYADADQKSFAHWKSLSRDPVSFLVPPSEVVSSYLMSALFLFPIQLGFGNGEQARPLHGVVFSSHQLFFVAMCPLGEYALQ